MRKDFGVKPWVLPQPVLIIGTYDESNVPNAMNAAWGGTYDFDKIIISVSKHKSTENIKLHKSFTDFKGECSEVGMYLAMARVALREGYPGIALLFEQIAKEEAEHAAKFAELLGEVITDSTKANLEKMIAGEHGACKSKLDIAKKAKELNYDAIHDAVHEMAKDEQRHGAALEAMLKRYFK